MAVAWFIYPKVLKLVVALKRTGLIFFMVLFVVWNKMLPENGLHF